MLAVDENFVGDVDVGASLDFGKKKKKKPKSKESGGDALLEGGEGQTEGDGAEGAGGEKGPDSDLLDLELDDLNLVCLLLCSFLSFSFTHTHSHTHISYT